MTQLNSIRRAPDRSELLNRYAAVRRRTEALVRPLSIEDMGLQSMLEASPAKWHLAHVTWFFERFVLARLKDYEVFDHRYDKLFNSYYLSVGDPFCRGRRGLLSRPGVDEILAYRRYVDIDMEMLLIQADDDLQTVIEIGLQHECQHQELILTDIKHAFFNNPTCPVYKTAPLGTVKATEPLEWIRNSGGPIEVGDDGAGFAFDNERPRHIVYLSPFRLASRLVTCGEFREFIREGGYQRPEFWLSDGWDFVSREGWRAPLYWMANARELFTLHGVRPIDPSEPVVHVSFYEADAFARWAGKRLPTEFEWEVIAAATKKTGNFLESELLHPTTAQGAGMRQLFGDAWEWTRSAYDPYPGYRPYAGPLGEYNGKFMAGQMVLRGGSCVSAADHIRATYRNYFPLCTRWQFSGIRLAEDA